MASDLRFVVTDKAHQSQGTLFAKRATVELAWNRASVAEFIIDDDHRLLPALVDEGARVRVYLDGVLEMSGLVETIEATFPGGDATVTVLSEFDMLQYVLAWPKPTAPIGGQDQEYRKYTGPSETVAKTAISEAVTRLSLGWTVAASAGKGSATRVETRFHPLPDRIIEPLVKDKLQLIVVRDEAGAVSVDVIEGATIPRTLTLASSVVDGGKWGRKAPTATRVIVGGSGEATARELAQFTDPTLESVWGIKREIFRDARSSEAGADLSTDGDKALAEGGVKASLSARLNEAAWFQYRDGYHLGDIVTVNVGPVEVTDVISQVLIEEDDKDGLRVTPSIGDVNDSVDKRFAAAVAGIARDTRDQGRA